MDKCMYCNSTNIVRNVGVGQTADAGHVGLYYRTKFLFTGTEEFWADVCQDCGSVVRLFVKKTDRDWYVRP